MGTITSLKADKRTSKAVKKPATAEKDASLAEAYKKKLSLPPERINEIRPFDLVKVKWKDADDEIVLVTDVQRGQRTKVVTFISVLRQQLSDRSASTADVVPSQIIDNIGTFRLPSHDVVGRLMSRPLNEREIAHSDALAKLEVSWMHMMSGILMLKEFTNAATKIGAALPELQTGDVEILTGLSVK